MCQQPHAEASLTSTPAHEAVPERHTAEQGSERSRREEADGRAGMPAAPICGPESMHAALAAVAQQW